jgi:protein tyrosine phosphatase/tRNA A-37 threonylcarbamoyl transferase component Bud32
MEDLEIDLEINLFDEDYNFSTSDIIDSVSGSLDSDDEGNNSNNQNNNDIFDIDKFNKISIEGLGDLLEEYIQMDDKNFYLKEIKIGYLNKKYNSREYMSDDENIKFIDVGKNITETKTLVNIAKNQPNNFEEKNKGSFNQILFSSNYPNYLIRKNKKKDQTEINPKVIKGREYQILIYHLFGNYISPSIYYFEHNKEPKPEEIKPEEIKPEEPKPEELFSIEENFCYDSDNEEQFKECTLNISDIITFNKILINLLFKIYLLHKCELYHLDLKELNILLNKKQNVRLIDFDFIVDGDLKKGNIGTSNYRVSKNIIKKFNNEQKDYYCILIIILFQMYKINNKNKQAVKDFLESIKKDSKKEIIAKIYKEIFELYEKEVKKTEIHQGTQNYFYKMLFYICQNIISTTKKIDFIFLINSVNDKNIYDNLIKICDIYNSEKNNLSNNSVTHTNRNYGNNLLVNQSKLRFNEEGRLIGENNNNEPIGSFLFRENSEGNSGSSQNYAIPASTQNYAIPASTQNYAIPAENSTIKSLAIPAENSTIKSLAIPAENSTTISSDIPVPKTSTANSLAIPAENSTTYEPIQAISNDSQLEEQIVGNENYSLQEYQNNQQRHDVKSSVLKLNSEQCTIPVELVQDKINYVYIKDDLILDNLNYDKTKLDTKNFDNGYENIIILNKEYLFRATKDIFLDNSSQKPDDNKNYAESVKNFFKNMVRTKLIQLYVNILTGNYISPLIHNIGIRTIKDKGKNLFVIEDNFCQIEDGKALCIFKDLPTDDSEKMKIIIKLLKKIYLLHKIGIVHGDLFLDSILLKDNNVSLSEYRFSLIQKSVEPDEYNGDENAVSNFMDYIESDSGLKLGPKLILSVKKWKKRKDIFCLLVLILKEKIKGIITLSGLKGVINIDKETKDSDFNNLLLSLHTLLSNTDDNTDDNIDDKLLDLIKKYSNLSNDNDETFDKYISILDTDFYKESIMILQEEFFFAGTENLIEKNYKLFREDFSEYKKFFNFFIIYCNKIRNQIQNQIENLPGKRQSTDVFDSLPVIFLQQCISQLNKEESIKKEETKRYYDDQIKRLNELITKMEEEKSAEQGSPPPGADMETTPEIPTNPPFLYSIEEVKETKLNSIIFYNGDVIFKLEDFFFDKEKILKIGNRNPKLEYTKYDVKLFSLLEDDIEKSLKHLEILILNSLIYKNYISQEIKQIGVMSDTHIFKFYSIEEKCTTLSEILKPTPNEQSVELTPEKTPEKIDMEIEIFANVITKIYFLHSFGYYHCDLKPENINININIDKNVKLNNFHYYTDDINSVSDSENKYIIKGNLNNLQKDYSCVLTIMYNYYENDILEPITFKKKKIHELLQKPKINYKIKNLFELLIKIVYTEQSITPTNIDTIFNLHIKDNWLVEEINKNIFTVEYSEKYKEIVKSLTIHWKEKDVKETYFKEKYIMFKKSKLERVFDVRVIVVNPTFGKKKYFENNNEIKDILLRYVISQIDDCKNLVKQVQSLNINDFSYNEEETDIEKFNNYIMREKNPFIYENLANKICDYLLLILLIIEFFHNNFIYGIGINNIFIIKSNENTEIKIKNLENVRILEVDDLNLRREDYFQLLNYIFNNIIQKTNNLFVEDSNQKAKELENFLNDLNSDNKLGGAKSKKIFTKKKYRNKKGGSLTGGTTEETTEETTGKKTRENMGKKTKKKNSAPTNAPALATVPAPPQLTKFTDKFKNILKYIIEKSKGLDFSLNLNLINNEDNFTNYPKNINIKKEIETVISKFQETESESTPTEKTIKDLLNDLMFNNIEGNVNIVDKKLKESEIKFLESKKKKVNVNGIENQKLFDEYSKIGNFDHQTNYNINKDRYRNILPYLHSKVELISDNLDDKYINANYIEGINRENEYIATQGPVSSTIKDFWRMIIEQEVEVIVMLTGIVEGVRKKCEQYYPSELEPDGKEVEDENKNKILRINNKNTEQRGEYTYRELEISYVSKPIRTVKQYHFTAWPDQGVPKNPIDLINFRNAVKQTETENPIVVHCSAGVGRTGTYIAFDIYANIWESQQPFNKKFEDFINKSKVSVQGKINSVEKNSEDSTKIKINIEPTYLLKDTSPTSIQKILVLMRHQRNNLVQTKEQYIYLVDALIKYLEQ